MIVCMCHGVRCSAVKRAIRGGAVTVDAVGAACDAGTDCGGCRSMIEDMIEEEGEGEQADAPQRMRLPLAQPAA